MADPSTGPSYTPPERRNRRIRFRMVAPLLVAAGSVLLLGGLAYQAITGPPTHRGLLVAYADGTERLVCASLLRVSGDEPVDPGEAGVIAPQWIEPYDPSDQPAPGPPDAAGGRADLVDAEGDVIPRGGRWWAALLDPDPPGAATTRIVRDKDGC